MTPLPRGPVMLDIAGTELTAEDRERLLHPSVGGIILFARNYASLRQLGLLTGAILALRDPPLLIAVDPLSGDLLYAGASCRPGLIVPTPPTCTLIELDPATGLG